MIVATTDNRSIAQATSRFMREVRRINPCQPVFHRVVEDVVASIMPTYLERRELRDARILERLAEPDRIITFRVVWQADDGAPRVNRAWRVQHNNALGPYKGGLRFREGLTEDTLKSLAFEQTLKNSLTELPMGGAKGGSNFNPKDCSDHEIMRFCQSLMIELHRHIGDDVDVPAGDMGVGSTEIGYLFGQYSRLANRWTGVLTGKGCSFGGSAVRREATGYGCVYFCRNVLERHGESIEGRRILISGSGTVATYAAEKALALDADVRTLSDSTGFVHFRHGMSTEHLSVLKRLKRESGGSIAKLRDEFGDVEFHRGEKPWAVPADVAMPCATENEILEDDADRLIGNGVGLVCEGANMPTSPEALARLRDAGVLFAPGTAANAGGVAVSGMELSQNSMRISWSRERVDEELKQTMRDIHLLTAKHGTGDGSGDSAVDYVRGANLAGFTRVAEAMLAYGIV